MKESCVPKREDIYGENEQHNSTALILKYVYMHFSSLVPKNTLRTILFSVKKPNRSAEWCLITELLG